MKVVFVVYACACLLCASVSGSSNSVADDVIERERSVTVQDCDIRGGVCVEKCYWMYCEEVESLLEGIKDKSFDEIVKSVETKVGDEESGWTWSAVCDGAWECAGMADDMDVAYKFGRLYQFAQIKNGAYLDECNNVNMLLVCDFLHNTIGDIHNMKCDWMDTIKCITFIYACIYKINNETVVQQCVKSINDGETDKFLVWFVEKLAKVVDLDWSNWWERCKIIGDCKCARILGEVEAVLEMLASKFV